MFQMFTYTTGLWTDIKAAVDPEFDSSFWDRAGKLLDEALFFPDAPKSFNSPVLGFPVSLFRTALSLRHCFRSRRPPGIAELERLQSEVGDWEARVLCDRELRSCSPSPGEWDKLDSREYCLRDASYLFAMVTSLLLEQVANRDAIPDLLPQVVPYDSWQLRLSVQILERHVGDEEWTRCYGCNWLVYTLGLFMDSSEDRHIIREEFSRRWDLTKFVQIARYSSDLEDIWAARDGNVAMILGRATKPQTQAQLAAIRFVH